MAKARSTAVYIHKGGKGAAVRRKLDSGELVNICECWYNLDFAEGCISQVPVELLDEVVENQGHYAGENFKIYKADGRIGRQRCLYCYSYKGTGGVLPKHINERTRRDFETHKPRVVRLSVSTEAGHPYYYPLLMEVFDLCEEFGSRIIFPTKSFPFGIQGARQTEECARENNPAVRKLAERLKMASGEEIAEKLKLIEASVMYSMGYDGLEIGACSQGFTNRWRIEQAQEYHQCGVNTSLIITCDVTSSIDENAERGSSVKEVLEARKRTGINARLLPIRPNSREILEFVAGRKQKDIVYDEKIGLLPGPEFEELRAENEKRPYQRRGNQEKFPRHLHPDFQKLVDDGMGLCGRVGDYEHCDGCNLDDRRIVFPIKEMPRVIYARKKTWSTYRKTRPLKTGGLFKQSEITRRIIKKKNQF